MFASTAATSVGYVYTAEVYPTEIRNVGVGCSSSAAMAGALCAPLMKLLGDAVWWLPPMINGTLGTFKVVEDFRVLPILSISPQ